MKTIREFLDKNTLQREVVDRFLDTSQPNWAQFDAELGYTLRDSVVRDGIDESWTIGNYGPTGERRTINYADRSCRINTYGDSFTMCHQVSNTETWQEYLAGHLGEPIRNYGVGGYGVYQAYRRMVRTESGPAAVPWVILNIFGTDDHYRSVDAWRGLRCGGWFSDPDRKFMFHSNPWVHVRFNNETGRLEERPTLLDTPESLYKLCDREFVYETFKDDLALNMYLGSVHGIAVDPAPLEQAAAALDIKVDLRGDRARDEIARLYWQYALAATMNILEMTRAFCAASDKKLMVLLSYGDSIIADACAGKPRADQVLVDYLRERGYLFGDAMASHLSDFAAFRITPKEYIDRYYHGHYRPSGNHFFAFAIKDRVVEWLDPKPYTYRDHSESERTQQSMRFDGYL